MGSDEKRKCVLMKNVKRKKTCVNFWFVLFENSLWNLIICFSNRRNVETQRSTFSSFRQSERYIVSKKWKIRAKTRKITSTLSLIDFAASFTSVDVFFFSLFCSVGNKVFDLILLIQQNKSAKKKLLNCLNDPKWTYGRFCGWIGFGNSFPRIPSLAMHASVCVSAFSVLESEHLCHKIHFFCIHVRLLRMPGSNRRMRNVNVW